MADASGLSDLALEDVGRWMRQHDTAGYAAFLDLAVGEVVMVARSQLEALSEGELEDDIEPAELALLTAIVEDGAEARYLDISTSGGGGHDRIDRFARTLDADLADAVWDAARGRGAFRRVRDVLDQRGKLDLWYAFEAEADREDARDWLRSRGLLPPDE
jgi:hypothetical protein